MSGRSRRTSPRASEMPLSLAQAHVLIAAAHDHAVANGWKIAVAVVDEGGLLVALGRMDGAFPLSSQIAEAKAAGTALWHRDGEQLAASRAPTRDSSTRSAGSSGCHSFQARARVDPGRRGRAGRSRGEWRERRRRPRLCRGRPAGCLSGLTPPEARDVWGRRGGGRLRARPQGGRKPFQQLQSARSRVQPRDASGSSCAAPSSRAALER